MSKSHFTENTKTLTVRICLFSVKFFIKYKNFYVNLQALQLHGLGDLGRRNRSLEFDLVLSPIVKVSLIA